jgi:flagellar basal-body rod modification protein FlgD
MSDVTNAINNAVNGSNTAANNKTPAATGSSGSSSSGSSLPNSTDSLKALNSDFQSFLKMLTTQLQNQDPTQPLDTNQFTQEIASLSTVEQGINTNKNLETLISLIGGTIVNNAVGYIGKSIQTTGNQGFLQNGQALFTYNLPQTAAKTTVTITNAAGQTVFSGNGSTTAGDNPVVWDGTNSITGAQMPNGVYKIAVTATGTDGKPITATTSTTGTVTAVSISGGEPTLEIGTIQVPLSDVKSVGLPPVLTN